MRSSNQTRIRPDAYRAKLAFARTRTRVPPVQRVETLAVEHKRRIFALRDDQNYANELGFKRATND